MTSSTSELKTVCPEKSVPHNGAAKGRPRRPNYKHIHRFPLPITVHPLPPLIPHNPLSLLSIALSYLTFYISPPQPITCSAYFDACTSSIQVTDSKTIRILWEMGFFGKGSLSRSEPSWLEREKKRRGLIGQSTSEEATRMRRVERRQFKLERARKEKEAIAEQLRAEGKLPEGPASDISTSALDDEAARETKTAEGSTSAPNDELAGKTATNRAKSVRFSPTVEVADINDDVEVEDEEHLQLSSEDAFFLSYGLGVLEVYDDTRSTVLKPQALLALLRQHSYFPPRAPSAAPEPDDRFMISYVAYHHFRSLGWVVRSGVKFGVDLLLYNKGPVFSHAEFAVNLLPSYSHPYWKETEERREYVAAKLNHTWWWLHCVNRVQAQVKKSFVMCFVEIPPPATGSKPDEQDIGELLKTYQVRELAVKRWVPNRSRD
ncbi:hypothetical protein TRV_00338 [Trichophyton verrucosum HKI 0517]|uniref:tRNA-splicing endonuclease subunit Sen2 n=1 Tax=Trichophyton verrucosum (strain HKI 0517) TaxID=663202 RepID=D4CZU5_TRIVH|nr:uncharacterized protein TRV_00338 [Trichophyton verrucosum HKI 0517]EFE44858.1 hypothetical protein TRV_00338 [Trichophyton verrucosum HKI 0517]